MIAKAQAISRKIALNATGFCAWARARLDDFMGARGGALLHVDPHDSFAPCGCSLRAC